MGKVKSKTGKKLSDEKSQVKQAKNIKQPPRTVHKKKTTIVERGKPHRWKKGEPSPNPSGRPKGSLCLTNALREILSGTGSSKKQKYKKFLKKLLELAEKGDAKLYQLIFDRIDGKVPDKLITQDAGPLIGMSDEDLDKIIHAGSGQGLDEPQGTKNEPE